MPLVYGAGLPQNRKDVTKASTPQEAKPPALVGTMRVSIDGSFTMP
jgi:hypothetical protein